MTRLGIKGSSNQQAELERQRISRAEKVRAEREKREQLRLRKELEKEREEKLKIAEFEETGFVVQVEGLVYGTSGEDVQVSTL
jgi:lipase chaperone LimK